MTKSMSFLSSHPCPNYINSQAERMEPIGGYCFPSFSTLGSQVHHWSRGIFSITLGIWFPQPAHDSLPRWGIISTGLFSVACQLMGFTWQLHTTLAAAGFMAHFERWITNTFDALRFQHTWSSQYIKTWLSEEAVWGGMRMSLRHGDTKPQRDHQGQASQSCSRESQGCGKPPKSLC